MRIAIVSRCARTLYLFRRNLALDAMATGADVITIGAGGDGFDTKLEAISIPFEPAEIRFPGIAPYGDVRLVLNLARRFRVRRIDVCHAFTIKPAIFATLAASIARVPVRVVTITGLGYAFTSAGGFLRRIVEMLYRISLKRAHVVVFQNPQDRRLFIERELVAPEKTTVVAGSGVDLRRFKVVPLPTSTGLAPVFLMVARLLRDKGVLEFLSAARNLRSRFPAARCLLLGSEDPRNPSCLTSAELDSVRSSQDVELLDEVDDVRTIIARADVVVLPSYREGLPRSLLEGAAMGRALIATDVPGCVDVVEHERNGLVVRRADAESLADAMLRVAANPALIATFGAAARAKTEAEFDEKAVIDNTLAIYRRLYSKHAKDAPEAPAR